MTSNSGSLAAWTSMWLAGEVAFDDVVHAMSEARVLVRTGAAQSALADAPIGARPVGVGEALVQWRQSGSPVRLALPVPGDVWGLSVPGGFTAAALDAGETVIGAGLALVPWWRAFGPSSAEPALHWWAFDTAAEVSAAPSVADAQYELTEAVRESAAPLAEISAFGWSDEVREQVAAARRAGERLNLPPGFPPRAVSLIAQAERLASVLEIALTGVAVDRASSIARDGALRDLGSAVRRARLAGYNAAS